MARTTNEQNIEQVAHILYEQMQYDPEGYSLEQARQQDEGDGWGFEVRYDHRDYLGEGSCTRVEGCRLSAGLMGAWLLAEQWTRAVEDS